MLKYLKLKHIVHLSNCRCCCRSLRNWNWNWHCHCLRNWLSLNWNGLNLHWNWQLEGTISTGESTRESRQGLPLAHRDFCSATATCWSAPEQEYCRQDAVATWNTVDVQMQGRLVLRRGISRREKQIIEQCKYMLVQPDWVAAVVVQVKTKGGTALVTDGTLAAWAHVHE